MHEAKVLTLSDSVHTGVRYDVTRPRVVAFLDEHRFTVATADVPDGTGSVASPLRSLADGFHGLVVTAGRTGFARRSWPSVDRLALLHRIGRLDEGETSVVVVASAHPRAEAFEAARYCIDTLKRTVLVWKRETWAGGGDRGLCAHDMEDVP